MEWQELRDRVNHLHESREKVLAGCRKLTQLSSRAIRHVHRHEFEGARRLLDEAKALAESIRAWADHPEMNPTYLHDSEKEFVEAEIVFSLAQDLPIPSPETLNCPTMAYLHGSCEAASEMRRFVLDQIRAGDLGEATRILTQMEAIYEELVTFDFPDSLTNGLRRSVDALRAVLERTRSDLTLTSVQMTLVEELRKATKVGE